MVLFNYATRELTAKIVYYGPGLCGKTTNLEQVHKSLPEKTRGKMISLATQTDRTLFFDFLPLDLGSVKGMKTRVQLYTVPGQVFYDATRKLVLKGADGVVFVVDSQKEMLESNLDSWENLKQNLQENNLDINAIPLVIQYNKRDLPNVLPIKDLNKKINLLKSAHYEASAISNIGVQETLKGIAKIVLQTLSKKYSRDEQQPDVIEIPEQKPVRVPEVSAPEDLNMLPADADPLDLASLDEEVKDLPHVDDLEVSEEVALALEPVETIEESPTLGQVEDVPELQEIHDFHEAHDIPEIEVTDHQDKEPEPRHPIQELPPISPQPSAYSQVLEPKVMTQERKSSKKPVISALEEIFTETVSRRPKEQLVTAKLKEPPVQEAPSVKAASATLSGQDLNVPIEISVGKEGQDVKLQININLKIRILPE
jgi:signal recognition particle receptor subunit beta